MRRLFLIIALAAIFALSAAEATIMVKLGLDDLAREADTVLAARVSYLWSEWDESGLRIYTYVALEPKELFKGDVRQPEIIVKVRGGIVGAVGQISPGTPSFDQGEDVVLFLKETADGFFSVVGLAQGKFSVKRDAATGENYVISNLSGIAFYDVAKRKIEAAQKGSLPPKTEYGYFKEKLIEAVQRAERRKPVGDNIKR